MAVCRCRMVPKNGRLGGGGLCPHNRRRVDLNRLHGYFGSQCFTMENGVSQSGCTSCIGPRHTDFTDLNGFHGYFGSQCFTMENGVSQCGCTSCIGT